MTRDKKLEKLLRLLRKEFGEMRSARGASSFETMVLAVLEPGNSHAAAQRAFKALLGEFVDWNEVRVSSWKEIGTILDEKSIHGPGEKAVALKKTLEGVFSVTHRMDLAPLEKMAPEKAGQLLAKQRDFDPGALAAVLYRCFDAKKLQPTADLVRVSHRIGFIQKGSSLAKMKQTLRDWVKKKDLFPFHLYFSRIAAKYCFEKVTFCERCPARALCQHGASVLDDKVSLSDEPEAKKKPRSPRAGKKRK